MIPVEVRQLSTRRLLFQQQQNEENTRVKLETIEEVHEMEKISEEATKLRVAKSDNNQNFNLEIKWCNPIPQGHWIEDSKKIGPKMQEKALGFSWALG